MYRVTPLCLPIRRDDPEIVTACPWFSGTAGSTENLTPPNWRKSLIFLGRRVGAMFMRVNSKCAHQLRPPPRGIWRSSAMSGSRARRGRRLTSPVDLTKASAWPSAIVDAPPNGAIVEGGADNATRGTSRTEVVSDFLMSFDHVRRIVEAATARVSFRA